jgi:hypothetical protein
VKKNGLLNGVQRYKCHVCKRHFHGGHRLDVANLWHQYVFGKQTYRDLAEQFGVSESTIKRKLKQHQATSKPISKARSVVLLMDATYWGRNWGVLALMDASNGEVLYHKFIGQERLSDYKAGVDHLEQKGFVIEGIVCDGFKGLFQIFSSYKVQMCQFHQVAIVRRYITLNPKLEAGRELKEVTKLLCRSDKESFIGAFDEWTSKWDKFLKERVVDLNTGHSRYAHKKLRSAYLSIKRNLPYLFIWYDFPESNIPNTNNKLEGSFTHLKNKLRNHNGLSKQNRKRFINEFFKA